MDTQQRLLDMAAVQLNANRRRGVSPLNGLPYDFVCPSTAHYPFQWFWDSCFHAIALCHIDVGLAEMELRCLLQGQRADGFIPHMLLWERDAYRDAIAGYNLPEPQSWTTDTIQPTLLATALRTVWEAGRSKALLDQLLPRVRRYYDWLRQNRDPDGDGLISILQPDESGLDASPKYDALLGLHEPSAAGLRRAMDALFATYRPVRGDETAMFVTDAFNVEDVMVNSIFADGLRDLGILAGEAGDRAAAREYISAAERTEAALLKKCWNAGAAAFWDLDGAAETPARILTVTSLFPLILASLPEFAVTALVDHLRNPAEFWTRYPLPSVAKSEATYNPREGILWRGPTWMNTNWFLVRGLRRHGRNEIADSIADASRELVMQHGFREYYHPDTGEPGGAQGFGWSTLVVDM